MNTSSSSASSGTICRSCSNGAWLTLRLSLGAFALGFALAMLLAFLRTAGPRPVRAAIAAYVEFIRNTPFLVQLFIIYFSLPAIGIRLTRSRPHCSA